MQLPRVSQASCSFPAAHQDVLISSMRCVEMNSEYIFHSAFIFIFILSKQKDASNMISKQNHLDTSSGRPSLPITLHQRHRHPLHHVRPLQFVNRRFFIFEHLPSDMTLLASRGFLNSKLFRICRIPQARISS
jgi:hypothetical protein